MEQLMIVTTLPDIAPIAFNYEIIRLALDTHLEKYRNLVIEDVDIPDAKADRAALNNLRADIDAERIRTKKEYLKPFEAYEAKLKELTAMIDGPAKEIDSKIKAFENRLKDEKKLLIRSIYNDCIGTLGDVATLDKIYDKKWETVAVKSGTIRDQIKDTLLRVSTELTVIRSMSLKFETAIIERYSVNLSLAEAFAYNKELIDRDEKRLSREQRKEESPAPAILMEIPAPPEEEDDDGPPTDIPDETPVEIPDTKIRFNLKLAYVITAYMTPEQNSDLDQWFKDRNIIHSR